jgi:ABC-2 type transport system ATP-binding protein
MLIEIDQLRLSLGGVPILHDVRLSLDQGEIYGLLGPNGAGKSTTIAAALGLLRPDAGRIRLLGRDPCAGAHELYGSVGVLPEQNGFYDWMSAEDYLAFFAGLHGSRLSGNEARRRLAVVDLESRARQPIGTYSRGMRQRLGLARALVCDPPLLILDEPTSGLDPRGRREIHDVLLELAARGVGILLCTHLLDDVDRLCRRVGIIAEGQNLASGKLALALLGTPVVLGFGFLGMGLGAGLSSARPALLTGLIALVLSASPVLLGPSLRQAAIGRAFDAVNPFSAAVNAYDAVIIDSQAMVGQASHLAVAAVWLALTLWLSRMAFGRVSR